ncbi:MAG: hypothetical protein V4487_03800 [Chlamydiota bacterium]
MAQVVDPRSSINSLERASRRSSVDSRGSLNLSSGDLKKLKERKRELERLIRTANRNRKSSLEMRELTVSDIHQTAEFKEDPLKTINRRIVSISNDLPKFEAELKEVIRQIGERETKSRCLKCVIL